jgi:glycosyltransferase involved in cell wall biosynthesis
LDYISRETEGKFTCISITEEEYVQLRRNYSKFRRFSHEKAKNIEEYSCILSTWANCPIALFSPYIKHIGVIHDLQMLKLIKKSNTKLKYIYHYFRTRRRVRKLDSIVAISKQTNREILSFANTPSTIIYNSFDPPVVTGSKPIHFPFSKSEKYILDINTFYRYKNAEVLLQAFSLIHEKHPEYRLYFKGNLCDEFERLPVLSKELGVSEKVYFDLSPLTNEEMSWIYSNASIFVTPSTMEGFGATPIEAITHNIPVIASGIDTLREVIGDCGVFFDPKNVDELKERLEEEIMHPTTPEELSRRREKVLKLYSSESQALNYYKLLKSL